ncbi:MAG: DUF4442 domain-containing protein [Bacteroidetes bacterium]|nr:DUF4442 domain-containing protein [Bacteroidota bacterium]MCH8234240.1 DUF4442 domain-containing protein [Bacteroidota bacterium]
MKDPSILFQKAKKSAFHLWLLNRIMWRIIPFNKPHRFLIEKVEEKGLVMKLPYIRKNLNHIKGLHACALATLTEYVTGLTLLTSLEFRKYRIIMKKIEMEYHYQGKTDAHARFGVSDKWIEERVSNPVAQHGAVEVDCLVDIFDADNNKLCTGNVCWQIKDWEKVKTKV